MEHPKWMMWRYPSILSISGHISISIYYTLLTILIPISCGCKMSCLIGHNSRATSVLAKYQMQSLPFIFFLNNFLNKSCTCPANSASQVHTQHFCDGQQWSHKVLLCLRFRTFALQGQKLAWSQCDKVSRTLGYGPAGSRKWLCPKVEYTKIYGNQRKHLETPGIHLKLMDTPIGFPHGKPPCLPRGTSR